MRARDLTRNRAERLVKAVLVLKAVLENLNDDHLPFEFPAQNAPRLWKPLITTRFAPASECRLQGLLGCADQMPRCLDPQVSVLGQGQCLLPRLFRQLPISERLH